MAVNQGCTDWDWSDHWSSIVSKWRGHPLLPMNSPTTIQSRRFSVQLPTGNVQNGCWDNAMDQKPWKLRKFRRAIRMVACWMQGWRRRSLRCNIFLCSGNAAILWCTGLPRSCEGVSWKLGKFLSKRVKHVIASIYLRKGMSKFGVMTEILWHLMARVVSSVILGSCWIHRTNFGNITALQGKVMMVMGETGTGHLQEIIGSSMVKFDKTRMMSVEQGHPCNSGVTACQESKQCRGCVSKLWVNNSCLYFLSWTTQLAV